MALWAELPEEGAGSLRSRLGAITCPVTVIVGQHDEPLAGQAPALAASVGHGRLTVIEGAYHSPQLTHPEPGGPPSRRTWPGRTVGGRVTDSAPPPQASDRIALAGSEVAIPPLGVGTWAWGDKGTWGMGGYDQSLTESSIRGAWEASIEAGIVLFDTAEIYGGGESERIIGRLLAADPGVRDRIVIATKFMPSPWKVNVKSALLAAARRSLERLGSGAIDLYQIHGPISLRSQEAMAEALAAAHAEGWSRRSVFPITRPRRRAPLTARCANAACGWPATRSSSRCCAPCRCAWGCWTAAASSGWCCWPTRRSGRDGSPASTRQPTRRREAGRSRRIRWPRSTPRGRAAPRR